MYTTTVCAKCGANIYSGDRFCGECGAPQTEPAGRGAAAASQEKLLAQLRAATVGEYEVRGEIGRGGMAVVYLGYDLRLNRKVAIKVMLPELAYHEGMDERFKHEARTAAKLDHPNVVVIYSVREVSNLLFFVMKFVDGAPLDRILHASGPLSIGVAQSLVMQLADALHYAHEEGVVHRDVKPANVIVDRRGTAMVTDFGIAKVAESPHLTRTGSAIGTPSYMSPEQCMAKPASRASDQYSLGAVAYEMLTGRPPFLGQVLEVQWAHVQTPPADIRTLRPDCPPALAETVMRALAKSPADRWGSLAEFARAVERVGADGPDVRRELVTLVGSTAAGPAPGVAFTPASPVPPPEAVREPAPPRLQVTPASLTIEIGEVSRLSVRYHDDRRDRSLPGVVTWETSDHHVAQVSQDGAVAGVAEGTATIAARVGDVHGMCAVMVTSPRGVSIDVRPAAPMVEIGRAVRLTAVVRDARSHPVDVPVSWRSSDPEVADVSADGTVRASRQGKVAVTASAPDVGGTVTVTVLPARVVGLSVTPRTVELVAGETARLDVIPWDSLGMELAPRAVEWSSSDVSVVTVTPDGVAVAHNAGQAVVTVSCDDVSASTSVSVSAAPAAAIVVEPTTLTVRAGRRARLRAHVQDSRGMRLECPVSWTSDDPSVAGVAPDGELTAVAAGATTVRAAVDGLTASADVTVRPPRAAIALPRWRLTTSLAVGSVVVVMAALAVRTATRTRTENRPPGAVVPDTTVANVGRRGDTARVVAPPGPAVGSNNRGALPKEGNAPTPGATANDSKAPPVVNQPSEPKVSSRVVALVASPGSLILDVRDSLQVRVRGQLQNGADSAVVGVRLHSTDETVARVSPAGWVTAIAPGRAAVVAELGTARRDITVEVRPAVATRVILTVDRDSLVVGESTRLRARALDRANFELRDVSVLVRSLRPEVASVNNSGEIVALGAGDTRLVASAGSVADTVRFVVSSRPVQASAAPIRDTSKALEGPRSPAPPVTDPLPPTLTETQAKQMVDDFARAVETRQETRVRELWPSDPKARDDFLKFVSLNRPSPVRGQNVRIVPGSVNQTGVRFELSMQRKVFGSTRQDVAAFAATLIRNGSLWSLTEVRLTSAFKP